MTQTFRAKGTTIFFDSMKIKNDDGSFHITMGGPLCEINEFVEKPEEVAKWLADLLNVQKKGSTDGSN